MKFLLVTFLLIILGINIFAQEVEVEGKLLKEVISKYEQIILIEQNVRLDNRCEHFQLPSLYPLDQYVLKIIPGEHRNHYYISITEIVYNYEVPENIQGCIINDNSISLIYSDINIKFVCGEQILKGFTDNQALINHYCDSLLPKRHSFSVVYYPFVTFFEIHSIKSPYIRKYVKYKTYMPYNSIEKMFRPVVNNSNADKSCLAPEYINGYLKPNDKYYHFMKESEGKFRIK